MRFVKDGMLKLFLLQWGIAIGGYTWQHSCQVMALRSCSPWSTLFIGIGKEKLCYCL